MLRSPYGVRGFSKYQHHSRLHQIETIPTQWSAALNLKSLLDWIRIAADWAKPAYNYERQLMRSGCAQSDEMSVHHLVPEAKRPGWDSCG